ncbi:MAG: Hemolysin C [Alphaproteobacteria bacterium MarineAlpha5_Bin11]|nr:magnesium/cobalt efflux protein [Pelagibacteraceae bacterium]PPR45146.1 MAG: Hemolysin C [Alphaproteobacteria bacterium MarineAlpha5_Bin11]PPR52118.1 MAG: Hemolysin C [Alphaproteobacteria bacterium MarineAlpha5_Bin10]|tara:strand:+ start:9798 stop:10679 length:882 start_codon:yes stop_codon:yes gene_type:complete
MKKDKKNTLDLKRSWRLWLVKKLLNNQIKNEEIYSFISQFYKNEEDLKNTESKNFEDNDENDLIKNILELNNKTVENVMVPRAEIIAVSTNDKIQQILNKINVETHSRMPVYKDKLDDVIGMIHVKDILLTVENKKNFEISNIIRDVLYVAPSSPVLDLLKRMRKSKIHLGLVVDEYGGVDGLVTIEDLVEEIVGEIEDEHDAEDYEIKIKKIDKNTIVVESSILLVDLEGMLSASFSKEEKDNIDTVGGLVFFLAGKIPSAGEIFSHQSGLTFEVIDASERRINKVKITINN